MLQNRFVLPLAILAVCIACVLTSCATAEKSEVQSLSSLKKGDTVTVGVDGATVEVGQQVLATLKKGDRLKVVEVQLPWVGVETNVGGAVTKGWIHSRNLQLAQQPAPPQGTPTAATPADSSAEWIEWRGPGRTNRSRETGLLKQWPNGGPRLLWTARGCGPGYSSMTVGGGLIYTAGNQGGGSAVIAYDLNGQLKWTAPCGKGWGDGTRGTPTYDNGKVYFENPYGEVSCLDAKTGSKLWSVSLMDQFGARNIQWAFSESVLIDGNNLICTPGGLSATMVALDKATGKTVWVCKGTQDMPAYASPVIVDYKGLHQIVTMTGQAAIGIHAKTGELLWRFEHKTAYDANIPTPIFSDGYLFIDSGYNSGGSLLQLSVAGEKASVQEVWNTKALDNHHGDLVLVDGYIYGASHQGQPAWVCLDFKTGEVKYRDNGIGKGSVTYADGMLYVFNESGGMGLVPATPQAHQVVSRFQIPAGGQGASWAHPIVCGGRLYVRHGDYLFALDVKNA